MSKLTARSLIRLHGVRHNNLKNFDLDLPLHRLIVITGVSGSGKSSLAFDTLFAEGQRRYTETFSPYARQFLDRMDKPQVDRIDGIPPAIAIEQRNAVKSTRSTVGTMTEICDYMKLLWPHIAHLQCRQCGRPVRKDSPQQIWQSLLHASNQTGTAEMRRPLRKSTPDHQSPLSECLITFELPLTEKLSLEESLALISKQGYQRLLIPVESVGEYRESGSALVLNDAMAPATRTMTPPEPTVIFRIEEAVERLKALRPAKLTVVQDRIKLDPGNRARFVEACEQAYHFGKGRLAIHPGSPTTAGTQHQDSPLYFSNRLHCATCDLEYRDPSPALFSFNHPVGACPACRGFGRVITIDYNLAIPDRSKTLAGGAVRPWQSGTSAECQVDLMKFCRLRKAPVDVPFEKLPRQWQDWVIGGDPGYGTDKEHEWPRAWYGVKGYFRWLESKSYKMHVRVLLSRYRSYTECLECRGNRFQPESLLYRVRIPEFTKSIESSPPVSSRLSGKPVKPSEFTLADFYRLPVRDALRFVDQLAVRHASKRSDPLALVLGEVRSRIGYLLEVGLGYLTLDRPTRSLSGGETERVNLTTCLGTRLVNTLYVLDEPSVGLHPRDTDRLVSILLQLRDLGNTVVVVEHEASVMHAADQIVDLGPGHGEAGGHIVFQGTVHDLLKSKISLTGQYLSGRRTIELPKRRPTLPRTTNHGSRTDPGKRPQPRDGVGILQINNANIHNLRNLEVGIPLGRLVCISGVSGSGKTTLVRDVLLPALEARLQSRDEDAANGRIETESEDDDTSVASDGPPAATLSGAEYLGRVVLVDQSPIGRTPRSNPAVYIGAFDHLRELFAQTEPAKQRGLNASAFSFNSSQGQCERCRGAGFEKIEMQFLSDVFIRCPDCNGRRYRPHILEIKIRGPKSAPLPAKAGQHNRTRDLGPRTRDTLWSIADLLDATVDEAIEFLKSFGDSHHARNARASLALLQEVGLGYLRLGQPINTLSGGESQRLKLVSHLAEVARHDPAPLTHTRTSSTPKSVGTTAEPRKPTLFLFDEPTTGLHFDDVRVLIQVFQRLVDAGSSVLVIEHNLDVIKCADWVIDLGPDAGDAGGQVVACGTPEHVAACEVSHTGHFLRKVLPGGGRE